MSEKEKKAIRDLIDSSNISLIGDGTVILSNKTISIILNLIEEIKQENEELKNLIERQQNMIKNALYIINKNEKEKIDETWLYNFDKCATLKGDNK